MKILRNLTLALGAAACFTLSAQSNLTPEIIFPKPGSSVILKGLSDNGKYAVASPRTDSDEDGISQYSGAVLYDISGTSAVAKDLGDTTPGTSALDVSDDGKTVVGSLRDKPAYWQEGKGWTTLPLPGNQYNGGHANCVTPDGRYAVGMVKKDNDGMLADGCMWDLTTNKVVEVPKMPVIDLSGTNQGQNWFTDISADGRYIFGKISFSYPDATNMYVYDRQTDEVTYVGHTLVNGVFVPRDPCIQYMDGDVNGKSFTPSGRYVSGVLGDATNSGEQVAFIFDVFNEDLKITNGKNEINSWAWNVTEDGIGLCTRPALDLYGECYIYYNNFYYPFKGLMEDVYNVRLSRYGIENTGKPTLVSADGKTIVFITSQFDSHVVRLKEDLATACDKLNLLSNWVVSPADGSSMTAISSVTLAFAYDIVASGSAASKIKLLKADGTEVASPLANGGVVADGNKLTITFRTRVLEQGEKYVLNIPAGVISVDGKDDAFNEEINLNYVGRGESAVKVVNISPADGSELSSLDISENPIVLTFDTNVMLNTNNEAGIVGHLYIDNEAQPVSPLTIAPNTNNSLVVYPPYLQYLYKGSVYRVEIPAGVAVDISGSGPSEAISFSYTGSFVPEVGNEQYLFYSTCDNYTNFLFYEGDHGTPTAEYADMGFTADETPWVVVRESEESTDMAFGSHSQYTDGRQSDDWFTTRQIFIPVDSKAYLSFDSQSYRKNKEDYLKVYIYTKDGVINALNADIIKDIRENGDLIYNEKQDPGASEGNLSGEWRHNVYPLDEYEGKNIYICFVNDNQQQSLIVVDNILVVREVNAIISESNQKNVVNKDSEIIKGRLSIASETEEFNGLKMTLVDAAGNNVSEISEPNITLSYGDIYQYEFPKALPLEVGVPNPYSIVYTLGDITETYESVIYDLTFAPEKRVVIEEFTGRDCQFCPGGIATMDHLENVFGNQLIPIALHCYNGSDPKGANVMDYWRFTGMYAAPQGIVNRGMITAPLFYSQSLGRYVNTKADLAGSEADDAFLWKDQVIAELAEPALMDITVTPNPASGNKLSYTATVKSAINLEDQNIRVFGVLVEDGLIDYQVNAYYLTEDPLLGEWGKGGSFAQNTAMPVTFNNVARSTWGSSFSGTAGLIPSVISSTEEYPIEFEVPVPGIVSNVDNCKFVVMLIDESTGRVINASTSKTISGVGEIADEIAGELPQISSSFGVVNVVSATQAIVNVYSLDGRTIASAQGTGNISLDLNGYNGVAIVKAQNASGAVSVKVLVK